MLTEDRETTLLEKAKAEEKAYNWVEVTKLYKQVLEQYSNNNKIENSARTYKMLGYAAARAAFTTNSLKDYIEQNKCAITAYKNAANLFKQIENRPEELECKAEAFYANYWITDTFAETKEVIGKAIESFIKSSDLYSKENNQKSLARILSRTAMASYCFTCVCNNLMEFQQFAQKGIESSGKAWRISKEIGDIQHLAESLFAEVMIFVMGGTIETYKDDKESEKLAKEIILKCDESLRLVEGCQDYRVLWMIYAPAGYWYIMFGIIYIDDEIEYREYFDKGLGLLEKSLDFARMTKDTTMIIYSIFNIDNWAIYAEKFEYIQNRIFRDIRTCKKLGKIFKGSFNYITWHVNFLPSLFYTLLALNDLFTPDQRKFYAKKGIKSSIETLKVVPSLPLSSWSYQNLNFSYSILTLFAVSKDEQDEYAKKMIYYAKQAKELADYYGGGVAAGTGNDSIRIAYESLANIAENDEEKIKMLTVAIDANEKRIKYGIVGRIFFFEAYMNLGLLYEKLGILTKRTETLTKAKETLLIAIKATLERGYHSYAAAIYEYIARIEDRIGNHTASAKNYKEAQETHMKLLKNIEYKPLKNRVQEKIEYNLAWNQLENAKAHHKKENHIKAKEYYEKASEILKNLSKYNYEAPYYIAWASLEKSELLSKQERQKEALEQYKTTRRNFEDVIKILKQASKQSEGSEEKLRIEKLMKVAKIRMIYCSARTNLEKARILGMQGKHLEAGESFAVAASQFIDICTAYKIERERRELRAIYYLCRAWEYMELAENYEDADRFVEAANLFTQASDLFTDTKLKLLASGNSAFCEALNYGCKFDESNETEVKTQMYSDIKLMLRKAASSYGKGGFQSGADWALATSTYFDAVWNLIRADKELNFDEKGKLLGIGSRYLKSAAELFGKANYKDKEKEVNDYLNRVIQEEQILVSALGTITKPSISSSTTGISAPSCPVEISDSTKLSEIREIREESRRVLDKRAIMKKTKPGYRDSIKAKKELEKFESEVAVELREYICIVHKGPIIGANYLCPSCKTFYCERCAQALKEKGENCWSCNHKIRL